MGEIIVQQKIRKRRKNGSLLRSLFIFFQQRYEELRLPDLKSLVNQISVAPVYMAILVTVFAVILFFSFSTASSGMTIQSDNFILPREDNIDHLLHSYMDVENDIPEELTSSAELPQGITQQLQENTYTLAPGDTLSEIAAEYGLTLDTLISYNGIRDVRRLSVGTELRIPNIDGVMYTVRRGDNLSAIAYRHSVRLNDITDANNMETAMIRPGDQLFIPGGRMAPLELRRVLGELFVYPTRSRFTSGFGMRRDPFTGEPQFHNGIDLANATGTAITAAMDGTVQRIGINRTYGRYIILSHAGGFQTWYAHLNRARVSAGQTVVQGQRIADMGNSGYSTGSHLHFSIYRRGEPINPMEFLH